MTRLFTDNAKSTLAGGISIGATSLSVASGDGAKYPNPVAPDYFIATLADNANPETVWEKVKVTARSGDSMTIAKAQEGSSDLAWIAGSKFELRWTAKEAQDAANIPMTGQAVLDFGAAPGSQYATVTISGQADITASSLVDAWIMAEASADHNAAEHAIVPISVRAGNIVPGVSFDIIALSDIKLTGQWVCRWVRTM